ncbi:hypothetical protein FE391_39775 [Nonomuraea sp. KC401]|uniref:Uncharacterized protein n=1 Tax=Nonomuraea longispora TaxID=1848320 RepID=A0A4R4NM67_9ACTN|nr:MULTISPECIES: hypothetical protein [Nonomuraea]NBE93319.1 hypothetical protein [Nonomuraea sp. K271]TDC10538.1 hypothetical protein E1267_03990 [Nonomuraea longispora]TLF56205.1 hypothetical protein FE391_39775 [Nonomuraea sp. KC401]
MNSPFGLGIARTVPAEATGEPAGAYDAGQQVWVGGEDVSAGYCTKFKVCALGGCVTYNRQLWDTGPIGC